MDEGGGIVRLLSHFVKFVVTLLISAQHGETFLAGGAFVGAAESEFQSTGSS